MCKEKTNKGKLALAEKKIVDKEIRETIKHLQELATSDPVHKRLESLL